MARALTDAASSKAIRAIYVYRALLGITCLIPFLTSVSMVKRGNSPVLSGVLLGTMLVHPMLECVWAALGPGSWVARWLRSIGWLFLLSLFLSGSFGPGVGLIALWMIAQLPLALARGWMGWCIEPADEADVPVNSQLRFSLKQIFLAVTLVAVMLGTIRILLWFLGSFSIEFEFVLAIVNILTTLPLFPCWFLRQRYLAALLSAWLLSFVVTFAELHWLWGRGVPLTYPIVFHLTCAGWTLLFGLILRWGGYRYVRVEEDRWQRAGF